MTNRFNYTYYTALDRMKGLNEYDIKCYGTLREYIKRIKPEGSLVGVKIFEEYVHTKEFTGMCNEWREHIIINGLTMYSSNHTGFGYNDCGSLGMLINAGLIGCEKSRGGVYIWLEKDIEEMSREEIEEMVEKSWGK